MQPQLGAARGSGKAAVSWALSAGQQPGATAFLLLRKPTQGPGPEPNGWGWAQGRGPRTQVLALHCLQVGREYCRDALQLQERVNELQGEGRPPPSPPSFARCLLPACRSPRLVFLLTVGSPGG